MQPHNSSRHRVLGVVGLNAALVLALLLPSGSAEATGTLPAPPATGVSAPRSLDDAAGVAFTYKLSTKAGKAKTTTHVRRTSHHYRATTKATVQVTVTATGRTTVSRSVTENAAAPDGSVLSGVGKSSATDSQRRTVAKTVTVTVSRTGRTKASATKAARKAAVTLATSRATSAAKSAAVASADKAATAAATKEATVKAQSQAHGVVVAALSSWRTVNWRWFPPRWPTPKPPTPTVPPTTKPPVPPTTKPTVPPTTKPPVPPTTTPTVPPTTTPPPTSTPKVPTPAIWAMAAAVDSSKVAEVKSWDCTDGTGSYASAITDAQHPVAQQYHVGASGRCEATPAAAVFTEGQERWFQFSTYLAPGFATKADWQVLAQWKNDGQGSPPLSLTVQTGGDNFAFDGGYGHPDGPKQWQVPVGKVVTGQWVDWKMHVVFSATPSKALLEVWRDGTKVISSYHPKSGTLYPARASNGSNPNGASMTTPASYLKYGIYRSSSLKNATWVGQSSWIVADRESGLTR